MNITAEDEPRIGASSEEITQGIKRNGYFLWPKKKPAA
jgi:hypothetical protein